MNPMVAVAMRTILAWYSPYKGKVPTLPLAAAEIRRRYGMNILDELITKEYAFEVNGALFPTKGGREAFQEATITIREGDPVVDQLLEIKAAVDRVNARSISIQHHLFN
jgi:hypothetical protein